jgi:hypothetical protein
MKISRISLACLPCLLAAPLLAQPQIVGVGGPCNSSMLNGIYSLTLTGRDVSSSVSFSNVLQGTGTATFDGQSKVTFLLTDNTNKLAGQAQTWSGTYSLQANCVGVVSITTGNAASFTLGSYDGGADFFIDGQDGVYSYLGGGNTQPTATCVTGSFNGTYQFNGNGFALTSTTVAGVNQISGLLVFNGTGGVTSNWVLSVSGSSTTNTASGTYTVAGNCTATANITDTAGNVYALVFTITGANSTTALGSNFAYSAASPKLIFSGNGRTL